MKMFRTAAVTFVASAAIAAGSAVAWQEAQIAKLSPLIGKWNATMEIFVPEIAGVQEGTATFSWGPNKKNIRAEATLKTSHGETHGIGFIGFDDNGADAWHYYRGAFMWDDDGRILTLEGAEKDGRFTFRGKPFSGDENKNLEFLITTDLGKDQFTVTAKLLDKKEPPLKILEIKFTRAKD